MAKLIQFTVDLVKVEFPKEIAYAYDGNQYTFVRIDTLEKFKSMCEQLQNTHPLQHKADLKRGVYAAYSIISPRGNEVCVFVHKLRLELSYLYGFKHQVKEDLWKVLDMFCEEYHVTIPEKKRSS